jgi:hypothetical protein
MQIITEPLSIGNAFPQLKSTVSLERPQMQDYRKEVSPYLSQNISRGSINNLTPFMIPAIFKADNDPIFSTRSVLSTVAI